MTHASSSDGAQGLAPKTSIWNRVRRAYRHRALAIGTLICTVLVVLVAAAPLLTSADPNLQRAMMTFQPPGPDAIMGTDAFGRDMFARVLYGGRVTMLASLTVVGLQLGNLLSGTVVVETVFSRPGLGRLLVDAILSKDYLTIQAVVLIIAIIYALVNFVVDLLYPVLDPRIARR